MKRAERQKWSGDVLYQHATRCLQANVLHAVPCVHTYPCEELVRVYRAGYQAGLATSTAGGFAKTKGRSDGA